MTRHVQEGCTHRERRRLARCQTVIVNSKHVNRVITSQSANHRRRRYRLADGWSNARTEYEHTGTLLLSCELSSILTLAVLRFALICRFYPPPAWGPGRGIMSWRRPSVVRPSVRPSVRASVRASVRPSRHLLKSTPPTGFNGFF